MTILWLFIWEVGIIGAYPKNYEENRDLLTEMLYKRNTVEVAKRSYTYDNLARPVTRVTQREGSVAVTDSFAYNGRGELSNATVNNGAYGYAYDTPSFGTSTATGDVTQPIQWSSEYADTYIGLTYYNYRHYNPTDVRWISRDPIGEKGGWNLYGFVGNRGSFAYDIQGKAIFILTVLQEDDTLIRNNKYGIPEDSIQNINKFLDTLHQIGKENFSEIQKNKKVTFNNKEFKGSYEEFRRKVEREKTSKSENLLKGDLKDVMAKLQEYTRLATEDYDVIGLIAHGDFTIGPNMEFHPTGNIKINDTYVKMDEVENHLQKLKKHVKWTSCFRDGKHQELGKIIEPKRKIRYMVNKSTNSKKCVFISFNTFNYYRYRAKNPGIETQNGGTVLIE